MARMVGESGRVIASDLQEGMLQKLRDKIQGTQLNKRIALHQCGENEIGLTDKVDFALLFYVLHEIPDQEGVFRELATLLKPGGKVLLVEPPIHVSKQVFDESLRKAQNAGLNMTERPRILLCKTAILEAGRQSPALSR
ncbi:MAG: class I SAM-dependent methyltransferase [Candidatus Eisenbacteria bacterium]|uniref:Class I SAM-dependent methyltransferase n=1 Tax=Eiseniibacteriota bacterium TaxID=2212470 RepID=A0A948W4P2_UNCEI|nr:class I SAM-dependent methyltransferase [Candidatus Eisenbacteria bacterium]